MNGHDGDTDRDSTNRDSTNRDEPFTLDNLKETDMTESDMIDTAAADTGITATGSPLAADVPGPRPRIRTGAIVWGALVSAVAVLVLVLATSPATNSAFGTWVGSLGVGGLVLAAVIALGAFIVLMAVLSLIRREQRRRSAPTR